MVTFILLVMKTKLTRLLSLIAVMGLFNAPICALAEPAPAAVSDASVPKQSSAPKRPFFRLTTSDKAKDVPAAPAAEPVVEPAVVVPTNAIADEREKEMLSRMDAAVQQVAGLYGNPRFVRLVTNDAAAAKQFQERLEISRSRDSLRGELAELEKRKKQLDEDIALRSKTLTDMDGRLIRSRAALDAISKAGDDMKRLVEDAAK